MTRKFGSPVPASSNPGGVNLMQVGNVALGGPASDNTDPAVGVVAQRMLAETMLYNPVTQLFERLRTASIFKTVNLFSAGDNTVWTPAAGKRFRLMAYRLVIPGNASIAVANVQNFQLKDQATFLGFRDDVFCPAAAGATPNLFVGPWVLIPGNGYLSLVANNVLFMNMGVAMATAGVVINTAGTEE
jgi:hypothetical protein